MKVGDPEGELQVFAHEGELFAVAWHHAETMAGKVGFEIDPVGDLEHWEISWPDRNTRPLTACRFFLTIEDALALSAVLANAARFAIEGPEDED